MSLPDRASASTAAAPLRSEIEQSAARYLFAIARLAAGDEDRVTTGELQEHLGVTPASVTEMSSKLDRRGYVEYEKYRGVTLTEQGDAIVDRVAWRFCIVSRFFDSTLNAALDEQTAFEMGFRLPRDGVSHLRELVTAPCHEVCPESNRDPHHCLA